MLTLYTNDAPETGCVAEQGAWALGAWWTGREAWARELGGGHADPAERRGRADRPAVRDRAGAGRRGTGRGGTGRHWAGRVAAVREGADRHGVGGGAPGRLAGGTATGRCGLPAARGVRAGRRAGPAAGARPAGHGAGGVRPRGAG